MSYRVPVNEEQVVAQFVSLQDVQRSACFILRNPNNWYKVNHQLVHFFQIQTNDNYHFWNQKFTTCTASHTLHT
jgi:hypothetical protein